MNGEGFGIGWRHLLDDMIATGQLAIASDLGVKTARGYFCCTRPAKLEHPAVRKFVDWIVAAGAESQAGE